MDPPRLRVAFDVTPLVGPGTGMGHATRGMWDALQQRGSAVHLLPYAIGSTVGSSPAGAGGGAGAGAGGGIPPATRRIPLPTRALVQIWARCDRVSMDRWLEPVDVVHATNFTVGPTRHATLLTIQDIGFVLDPTTTDRVTGTFAGMLRRSIGRGAHVHVTTDHLAHQVEEHFGPGLRSAGRISVVPLGIPALAEPAPLPPDLAGSLAGRPYALALGDQVPRKNLPMLVRAFGGAAAALPDLCLVLAGPPGASTPAVRAAAAALPADAAARVLVAGAVGDGARVTLLAGATVLAYPSLYEGFGLPPLEAMSLGVPALVSNAGALREVAGPAAELLAPEDLDGWTDGLCRLVTDEARRDELIAAGRRHAARFTWEATATGLLAAYRRAATSS